MQLIQLSLAEFKEIDFEYVYPTIIIDLVE